MQQQYYRSNHHCDYVHFRHAHAIVVVVVAAITGQGGDPPGARPEYMIPPPL